MATSKDQKLGLVAQINVWNCTIRLFVNIQGEAFDFSDYVSKRDMRRAEKIVDRQGAINTSGIYGSLDIVLDKEQYIKAIVTQMKAKLDNVRDQLETLHVENRINSDAFFNTAQDVLRRMKYERVLATITEHDAKLVEFHHNHGWLGYESILKGVEVGEWHCGDTAIVDGKKGRVIAVGCTPRCLGIEFEDKTRLVLDRDEMSRATNPDLEAKRYAN